MVQHQPEPESATLKMEAVYSPETS